MTDEIGLDELERRLREKWEPEKAQPAVDHEAMAVARKLMDGDNARRLARTRRGDTFRYRAPVITGEYYFTPPGPYLALGGGWTFTVFENGRKRSTTPRLTEEACQRIAALMRAKGCKVNRLETEAMKAMPHPAPAARPAPAPSQRKAILQRLGSFRA